ncbi:hypothetical protein HPB50_024330 [Hyalomma asiaticum]|uniref:Uncharacterized protein n=1 Tax=Hyalomma asiaticum TaxID=266040 RepID=A0ACB7TB75_HYAAI|nr:hypothetical protein HPB50_024330 [Hyalomma asiaticum]
MATSGSAANEALVNHRPENVSELIVDLEGVSLFSGSVLDYRAPCMASAGRTCQIMAHISVWNEFLFPIDLELRELPYTGRQFALESVHDTLEWQEWYDERDEHKLKQAATALFWLLKIHRCVATLCIPYTMSEYCISLLCEALDGNTSLKSLTLGAWLEGRISERFWKVVMSMKCLEELDCSYANTLQPRAISAVLLANQTLTVLHLDKAHRMDESLSRLFLAALKENTTLRVLSMHSSAIAGDPDLFVQVMSDSSTLQDITVTSGHLRHPCEVEGVFRGMLKNRSIVSLRIQDIILDDEIVELAAQVFTENKVLRRFHLSLCPPQFKYFNLDRQPDIKPISVPPNTVAWQEAIAHNCALEDLMFSFNIWCAEHWEPFFRVLSKHATLKTVTIVTERKECSLLLPVMKALERTGSEDKVSLKASGDASTLALPGGNCCSKLDADLLDETRHNVLPVLQRLSTFCHLEELRLKFFDWDNESCTVVLEYIAAASTLRKLDVNIHILEDDLESVQWLQALSKSLLLNGSITELGIGGYFDRSEGLGGLGEAVSRSHTIRKFHLLSFEEEVALEAFLGGLRLNISDNYVLCSAKCRSGPISEGLEANWFDVTNTARRNYGLVVRAARFLNNTRPDRSYAAALETVSRHPALVAELAEVLSIGIKEASAMVRQRLQNILGLHEFMRLAGVVREWVTCQPREDGSKQLDTLDDYCWRHVRQYLHLDDVIGDLTSPVIP